MGSKPVIMWSISDGEFKAMSCKSGAIHSGTDIVFSPDRETFVTLDGREPAIRLWHIEDGCPRRGTVLQGFSGIIHKVAISPSGRKLASVWSSVWGNESLWIWDMSLTTPKKVKAFSLGALPVWLISFTPDESALVEVHPELRDGEVKWLRDVSMSLIDVITGRKKDHALLRGHRSMITAFALSPDCRLLFSGDNAGTVICWDTKTHERRAEWAYGSKVDCIAVKPDGRQVAVGYDDGTICLHALAHLHKSADGKD
jgi:WD40 repeat protein